MDFVFCVSKNKQTKKSFLIERLSQFAFLFFWFFSFISVSGLEDKARAEEVPKVGVTLLRG